ncbi:MAG TPA: DUF6268 family outer membrane beta-barrel protein [Tepidisphaeraceae bacterium]|jgi:hypothetical protein
MLSFQSRQRLISACVVASARIAVAAEPTEQPEIKPTTFILGGDASYAFDADIGDFGSFSVFRTGGSLSINSPLNAAADLRVVLDGEYSHYFFNDFSAVPGADGSDSLDAYQFGVRPSYSHYFSPNFGVFGGVSVNAAGMAEADIGESLTYGVFAGFNYQVAPKVWVGAGFAVTTELEDGAFAVPLLTLNWAVTPNLLLSSEGLGLKATYTIDDAWAVYIRGRYEWRQFRLDSGEVLSEGVLTDQSVPITVGVTYDLDDKLSFSAEAGVVAYRRLEFTESDGDEFGADEADPAGFLSVRVQYTF